MTRFDEQERRQRQEPQPEEPEDARARPGHDLVAIGLDAVGDRAEDEDDAKAEGQVAAPVDPAARGMPRPVPQLEPGPDGADEADRDIDPEDEAPAGVGQQPADDEAEELSADGRYHVDAEREAALLRGEGVGEDGGGIGHDQRAADALDHADDDEIGGGEIAPAGQQAERQSGDREDREAEGVHARPAVLVAQPAEGHDEHGGRDHVADDRPEHVVDVAGVERPQPDAAKDRRQANEQNRTVDGRRQHAERRVAQRHPFVAVGGLRPGFRCIHPAPLRLRSARRDSRRYSDGRQPHLS